MPTEDAERSPPSRDDTAGSPASGPPVSVGRYSWRSLLNERGHEAAAAELYADIDDGPAVPAGAVSARFENGIDRVVRADDVDEPFRSDGSTPVPGHGTPDEGTVVVGGEHVVVSGDAVVPDGTTHAVSAPDAVRNGAAERREASKAVSERDDGDKRDDGEHDLGEHDADGTEAGEPNPETDARDEAEPDEPPVLGPRSEGVDGAVVVAGPDVETVPRRTPTAEEWDRVDVDPSEFLGFDPSETAYRVGAAAAVGDALWDRCSARYDLYAVPVLKGYYTWDDYAEEYFLDEEGNPPTDEEDEPISFSHEDKTEALGFDPERTEPLLGAGGAAAADLAELVDERTVDVNPEVDEDASFRRPTATPLSRTATI